MTPEFPNPLPGGVRSSAGLDPFVGQRWKNGNMGKLQCRVLVTWDHQGSQCSATATCHLLGMAVCGRHGRRLLAGKPTTFVSVRDAESKAQAPNLGLSVGLTTGHSATESGRSNGNKLSDACWRGRTWNATQGSPPESVRSSAGLGAGSVTAGAADGCGLNLPEDERGRAKSNRHRIGRKGERVPWPGK